MEKSMRKSKVTPNWILEEVTEAYEIAERHNLTIEVFSFAMSRLAQDDSEKVRDALTYALEEWIK